MSKEKTATPHTFVQELFHFGLYKRSQGRITRQVTFAALAVVFALAAWRLYVLMSVSEPAFGVLEWMGLSGLAAQLEATYSNARPWLRYLVPFAVLGVGLWASFRVVNLPRFADFLIAVEAEMNKVSWPSRTELFRSSFVVIFVIFSMALILFAYDLLWQLLFEWLGIRH